MSRHRNVRKLNYDDERYEDEDYEYGHSYEDRYCVSPSTAAQFTFNREQNVALSSYMSEEDIPEEDNMEIEESKASMLEVDQVRLSSCLDQLHGILGDSFAEPELIETVTRHSFNIETALDELLQRKEAPKPQRTERKRRNHTKGDDRNIDLLLMEIDSFDRREKGLPVGGSFKLGITTKNIKANGESGKDILSVSGPYQSSNKDGLFTIQDKTPSSGLIFRSLKTDSLDLILNKASHRGIHCVNKTSHTNIHVNKASHTYIECANKASHTDIHHANKTCHTGIQQEHVFTPTDSKLELISSLDLTVKKCLVTPPSDGLGSAGELSSRPKLSLSELISMRSKQNDCTSLNRSQTLLSKEGKFECWNSQEGQISSVNVDVAMKENKFLHSFQRASNSLQWVTGTSDSHKQEEPKSNKHDLNAKSNTQFDTSSNITLCSLQVVDQSVGLKMYEAQGMASFIEHTKGSSRSQNTNDGKNSSEIGQTTKARAPIGDFDIKQLDISHKSSREPVGDMVIKQLDISSKSSREPVGDFDIKQLDISYKSSREPVGDLVIKQLDISSKSSREPVGDLVIKQLDISSKSSREPVGDFDIKQLDISSKSSNVMQQPHISSISSREPVGDLVLKQLDISSKSSSTMKHLDFSSKSSSSFQKVQSPSIDCGTHSNPRLSDILGLKMKPGVEMVKTNDNDSGFGKSIGSIHMERDEVNLQENDSSLTRLFDNKQMETHDLSLASCLKRSLKIRSRDSSVSEKVPMDTEFCSTKLPVNKAEENSFIIESIVFDQSLRKLPSPFARCICLHWTACGKEESKSKIHHQNKKSKFPMFHYKYQTRKIKALPVVSEHKIWPFDFKIPSPDDIVKLHQKAAFTSMSQTNINIT